MLKVRAYIVYRPLSLKQGLSTWDDSVMNKMCFVILPYAAQKIIEQNGIFIDEQHSMYKLKTSTFLR